MHFLQPGCQGLVGSGESLHGRGSTASPACHSSAFSVLEMPSVEERVAVSPTWLPRVCAACICQPWKNRMQLHWPGRSSGCWLWKREHIFSNLAPQGLVSHGEFQYEREGIASLALFPRTCLTLSRPVIEEQAQLSWPGRLDMKK